MAMLYRKNPDYNVIAATVISNERKVYQDGKVTYMPVYFVMFMETDTPQTDKSEYFFWSPPQPSHKGRKLYDFTIFFGLGGISNRNLL